MTVFITFYDWDVMLEYHPIENILIISNIDGEVVIPYKDMRTLYERAYSMEKTTLYLDDDIKCTYYPSTRNMLIENELTGECVTLNYSCWQKVFAWFNSISKRKADC